MKKVLVHGTPESLKEFFNSPFNKGYEVLAILSNSFKKPTIPTGGGGKVIKPQDLPQFSYRLIDGILLTDRNNWQEDIEYFFNAGVEPRKIILWDPQGMAEFFNLKDTNGVDVAFMEGLEFHIKTQEDFNFLNEIQMNLMRNKIFSALNLKDYPMVFSQIYENTIGKPLDWNNLQTWTEKMQWIKLYDNTPLKTHLADKFLVRQWVAEKIGEKYLIPFLGVWNDFDEINFDELPNQFVLKCNHGCGMNIICRDKNSLDIQNAREKINAWLAVDFGKVFFEPHYSGINRKIIAEKFMTDEKNFDLPDYKFLCFDGKPIYCFCCSNRSTDLRFDYFDMNWNNLPFERADHIRSDNPKKILQPKNFELMKKLAAELCEGFSFVRVDFYEAEGKIYFGEMTFTPAGGNIKYNSEGTDEHFGSLMTLPV